MAKLKRGKMSLEEMILINAAYSHGTSVETIAKALNRSETSIRKHIGESYKEKQVALETEDPTPIPESIPDPPPPLDPGYAKRHFEIPDSKNPGKKRKGIAIMTEAGSEAGDSFLKSDRDGLLPMSVKHRDCIVRAQND